MAILESNTDLDVKGRVLATTVPNSTGSIVTWNASTKVFGLRSNAQIISDLGLQSSLTAGSHINITSNSISAILSDGVWLEDSAGNRRIHVGSVSSTNDFLFRSRHTGFVEFKWQDAAGTSFMEINGTTLRVQGLGGTGSSIIQADSSGSIFRSGIDPSNIALQNGTYPNMTVGLATIATNATKLQTARTINGTSFDGTANITTALWGTARNITIGNKTLSVNGSGNYSWSLAEIGASSVSHTHPISDITGLQNELDKIGNLPTLTTNNKNNLVDAINEINGNTYNIEIGGRNLIVGSFNDWRSRTISQYGYSSVYIPIQDDWRGKTVTHSFEVKDIPAGESVRIRIDFYRPDLTYTTPYHGNVVSLSGKSFVSYTVTADTQFDRIRIRILPVNFTSNYSVLFRCEKLEFGNKPTDWTPAPEDQISDWNQSDSTKFNFIKNKPTIPTVNNGALTLTTGTGLSGSANFTANQSGNSSFSVGIASTHKLPTTAEWAAALVNTTYTAGTGLSLSGTTFGQSITTSGTGTFVTGITQTTNGFQINLGTPPNTNTTYTGSNGINITGTVISPTYGTAAGTIAQGNDSRINNGQTAFSWGNHALAGYLTASALNNYYQSGDVNIPTKGGDYRVFPEGGNAENFDWNSITSSGFYKNLFNNGNATTYNSPKNGGYWHMENLIYASASSGNILQYAHPYRVADGMWMRSRFSGTWTPWVEFIHSGNLASYANSLLTGFVPTSRTITAGNGLSGGGNLTANRTITLGTPSAITLSSTNSVTSSSHTHALDSAITTAINNGQTAYGWGNHALAGYLTSVPDSFVTKNNISSSALSTTVIDFDSAGNGASILYAGASSTNKPIVSGTDGGLLIRGNHSTVGEYQLYLARGENDALLYRNQSGVWNRVASREWVGTQGFSTQTLTAGSNISISGNVISATNTNTTYSAGTGLSLTGTTFANTAPNATHTGDVTGSTALTIANNAVTHAKYQNIPTQRILGRGAAGTGNVQELTLGANLSLSTSGVLSATNTNTTYTAGTGLTLSGTTFGQTITTNGTGTFVQSITQTANGFQVNLGTPPNTNTTYALATDAELASTTSTTARLISGQRLNAWATTKGFLTSVPTMTAATEGTAKLFSATVQSVAATSVSATASRTYGIQKNSSGQLVVNVPWTNTTYSAGTLALLQAGTNATNRVWSASILAQRFTEINNNIVYYKDSNDNVNSNVPWGTNIITGARNQVQGARNIVNGEDINVFGSRNISSGINNQINGFANVANGVFNTIKGAYSSINGSQANTIGNYLFARDNQTVLGMYNKVYDVGEDEGLRFAFGTGMNDLDKFNAVEIYEDHRTEFHGRATYDEETRDPAWFTEDYTHVDTYQMGYDHLTHGANGSTPCVHNILAVAVRNNHVGSHDRFVGVGAFELAFDIHGIVEGSIIESNLDRSKIHTKGTLQFPQAVRQSLLERARIDINPYLVVEYVFDKSSILVKYVDAFYLKNAKNQPDRILYIIGSFINRRGSGGLLDATFFEFNQQII